MSILDRLFKLVRKEKLPKEIDEDNSLASDDKENDTDSIEDYEYPEVLEELDNGQKSAVTTNHKRTLVLAGAGAGKTRVLIHRILHLIMNCKVNSGNILAVTFTRDATYEMKDRLISHFEPEYFDKIKEIKDNYETYKFKTTMQYKHPEIRNLDVKTIHSLCYQILRLDGAKVFNTNFQVIGDEDKKTDDTQKGISQQKIIKNIIFEIGNENPDYLEKVKKFIYDYLVDYEKITLAKLSISPGKYMTLDGKEVRSKSERDIANFLIQHNIKYDYEREATWVTKSDQNKRYHPDFYLPEYDIYIEHWAVTSSEDATDKNFEQTFDKEKYLAERKWKISQFKKHNKKLIESSEKQMRGNLNDYHQWLYGEIFRLTNGAIKFNQTSNFILEDKRMTEGLILLIRSFMKIINLAKSNRVSEETIKTNLKKEKHEEILEFYDIFLTTFGAYEEFLIRKSLIDYNDMIHKVIDLFNVDKKILLKYQKKYKHILVDEYQDVSSAQVELISLLLCKDNSLFAVGDDWQSIYGFRGSEVEFIVNFNETFKDSNVIVLPYNYRSGKNIVDASNIVIMKNPNQINKHIKAFYENKDEKIFQYNALNDIDSANFIIDVTKKHYAEGYEYNDILLLYRRSRHIYPYKEYFKKHNFKINTKTIHGSKGLEAKIVFLIGMTTDGFPFVWEDSRVIQVIKKTDLLRKEEEERRIFYVAMTRAQERLILLSEKNNESSYCSDIPSDFKKVKVSKQEFTEEMLSPKLRGILQRLEDGQNPDEISIDLDEEQTNVEKYIARLIEMGLVDVKKFVNEKNYALIASEIPSDEQSPRLNPIKRALPKSISYGEIRYVIADWKHKQKE